MTKTLCEVYPIGGVIGSMHASNAVDHGFEPWLGWIKDYKIGVLAFLLSTQH